MLKITNYTGHAFDFGDHGVVIECARKRLEKELPVHQEFESLPEEILTVLAAHPKVTIEPPRAPKRG